MDYIKTYINDLFPGKYFFPGLIICVCLFVLSFFFPIIQIPVYIVFLVFVLLCALDYILLFLSPGTVYGERKLPVRFSNGDDNIIEWGLRNYFRFSVRITLIDEWPLQLQMRKSQGYVFLKAHQQKKLTGTLRPVQRGVYEFGNLHLLTVTRLNLLARRITMENAATVPCYPSYVHLPSYGLSGRFLELQRKGSSRTRKIGQSLEFEQIKDYFSGDDIRTLNWKATARKGRLMVNSFREERSQQVYCILDKGRLMKMPFHGMTLLDYAINSSLVISDICLRKGDKAGIITFSNEVEQILPADGRASQAGRIMDLLYRQETDYLESDYEKLYATIRSKINQRSLLILYANFESISGLRRNLNYLRALSKFHLLLVVFFENTELEKIAETPAKTMEQLYTKVAAQKFTYEKRLIVRELYKHGILSILSAPEKLTMKTLNKYLELKMKRAL